VKRIIAIISDKSGSMFGKEGDVEGGLATFMAEQREIKGETLVTLVEFSSHDQISTVHDLVPIKDVGRYHLGPGGNTALLDAIGSTVINLKARIKAMHEDDRPDQVVLVISTDGDENDSVEFKGESGLDKVKNILTKVQRTFDDDADAGYRKANAHKRGWTVYYLGAGEDAIRVGNSMGVAQGHSLSYADTGEGTSSSYAAVSRAVTRSGLGQDAAFTDDERAMTQTGVTQA
jgi:hypothetical protein